MTTFPFGGSDEDLFDDYGEFVPGHVPDPGPFLEEHDVLAGEEHVAFHETTRDLFEERGVYDMTFDYNLARLNLDTRHPGAGFRYAVERGSTDGDDPAGEAPGAVLRAEFTPTTPFCPQTHTLTKGSFRAWNGDPGRHDYDLVRVRAAPMHHRSEQINEQLAELEESFLETGEVVSPERPRAGSAPGSRTEDDRGRGSTESPF